MMRILWQRQMIALARSEAWTGYMQSNRSATQLARRYVAGDSAEEALECAGELAADGISCSAFYLGEYVDDEAEITRTMQQKSRIVDLLGKAGLDIHLSVDPTQLGCGQDWEAGSRRIATLAENTFAAAGNRPGRHCVMLDMEDFTQNAPTIELYNSLAGRGLPVALTLQAYLRKTEADIRQVIERGGMVRLVKGAFAAGPELAFTSHKEIKANYRHLIEIMFSAEARARGFYPVIASHDHRLQEHAIACARANGWAQGSYEFEMLFGSRNDLARRRAADGEKMRLYLPFGTDWWPYAVRRIGENPRSMLLLMRGILGL